MNKKKKRIDYFSDRVLLLLLSAVFCYQTVRDAIINNEKEKYSEYCRSQFIA